MLLIAMALMGPQSGGAKLMPKNGFPQNFLSVVAN
jgi:hypothetical protein